MDKIKLLYIDDDIDLSLSKYLGNLNFPDVNLECDEKPINENYDYASLLNDVDVETSNLIIIDSKLFEDESVQTKFTGEEIKIILNKLFPFIEVIIISQNEAEDGITIIPKYNSYKDGDPAQYYDKNLKGEIRKSINKVLEARKLIQRVEKNNNYERILVEKIENSLNGMSKYDELKKSDIDSLIGEFKKLEEMINGK